MGRAKAAEDPGASSSRAPAAHQMHGRSLDDLPEEALSNIAGRLMEFSPPFERECQAVRKSIGLASTCARLRRIVIAAWCQKLLGVPIDNLGKGKAKVKVKIDVSDEEVEVASVKQLQQWCQQMGLKKSGKKAELQQRVLSAQNQNPESTAGVPSELKRLISSQNRARVTVTNAKKEYRVGEQELSMLPSEQRPNPIDPTYAPMRLYLVNDVLAAAKARFMGDADWFRDSSRRAPKLTGEGLAALRQEMARRGQPVRRAQVEKTLQTHGLDADKHRAAFFDYIQTGAGSLDMVVRAISTSGQPAREAALREALRKAGLPEHHATSCQLFRAYLVNAQGKGPADLVPMLQRQLAYEASRLEAATAALAAAGLDPAHHLATDSFSTHIKSGAGSLTALVEAAQAAAALSAAATSALAAAGLNPADCMAAAPFLAYVNSGAGVLDELVADAVQDAARKHIAVKLVAAGLPAALAGALELQPCVQAEVAMLHAAGAISTGSAAAAQDADEPAGQAAADGVQTDSNSGTAAAGVSPPVAASAAALPETVPAAAAATPQPPAAASALGATLEALTAAAAAPLQRRAAAFAALQEARLLPVGLTEQGAGLEGAVLLEAPELQPYLMGAAPAQPMDAAAVAGGSAAGEAAGAGVAGAGAPEAPSSAAAAEGMLQAAVQALAARLKADGAAAQQRSKQQEPSKRAQQTAQQRQAAVAAAARAPAAAHMPPLASLLGQAAVKQEPISDIKGLGFKTEALHAQDLKQEAVLPGGPSIKQEAAMKLEAEGDDGGGDDSRKGQGRVGKRRVKQEPGRPARHEKQPGRRRHRRATNSESEEDGDVDGSAEEVDEGVQEQEQQEEQVVAAAATARVRRRVPKRGRKRKAESDSEQQQEDDEQQVRGGAADEEAPRPAAKRAKGCAAAGMCACCGEGKATRQCQHSCCGDCCPGPCKRHGC